MTEEEWLRCMDPEKMLLVIRDRVSERKMRLFAIACCRHIWDRITDPRCRAAVEFAERFGEVVVLMLDGWRESARVQAEIRIAGQLGKPVGLLGWRRPTVRPRS